MLARENFGDPVNTLTPFQKWQYSLQLLLHNKDLQEPVSAFGPDVIFTIPSGASVTSVSIALEDSGLISNWQAFRYFVIYKGLDTQIKAGDFSLSQTMTAIEISETVQSSFTKEVPFYIYPGWRAEEIAAALPSSGIEVTPEQFMAVVLNPGNLPLISNLQGVPSLEGFLFPGSYTIDRQVSAEELAMVFVQRFSDSVPTEFQTQLTNHGLSFYQAVILASIIQRETFDDAERSLMASVFYNRLALGMKLETDPTVQYALGYSETWGGWWKTSLALSDLDTPSEFNTYQIAGLPPRPISNPDLPSLLAVAQPSESAFLYFRAKCDNSGSHLFSQTFDEHLANACP